jgi:N-acetylglutamate synthase-like GNAT family acetyltransferase
LNIEYRDQLIEVDWAEMKSRCAEDNFDNGRTPAQLQKSFENSHATCIAYAEGHIIGTARVLSDGVCNAYLIDVWTYHPHRNNGIARTMIQSLLTKLPGQHVYTFTDDVPDFYKILGFTERPTGLEKVVGNWLDSGST